MVVVQAILPIFGLIVVGYLMGWRQWLSSEAITGLSGITFKLFMPVLLFAGIAKSSLSEGFSPLLLFGYFLPALLVFGLVNLVGRRFQPQTWSMGLVASYSNNVLVGTPLVALLLGKDSLVYVFAILVVHSLILFSLQSVYLALRGSGERVDMRSLLRNLTNPIIIGLLLGALLNLSGLALAVPAAAWQLVDWLAQAALPCALIVLGAGLTRYRLKPSTTVLLLSLAKLLVMPLLVLLLVQVLPELNPQAKTILVLLAACPVGVNVLAFARSPEDHYLASSTVFLSTLLSAVSLPLWLLWLL